MNRNGGSEVTDFVLYNRTLEHVTDITGKHFGSCAVDEEEDIFLCRENLYDGEFKITHSRLVRFGAKGILDIQDKPEFIGAHFADRLNKFKGLGFRLLSANLNGSEVDDTLLVLSLEGKIFGTLKNSGSTNSIGNSSVFVTSEGVLALSNLEEGWLALLQKKTNGENYTSSTCNSIQYVP